MSKAASLADTDASDDTIVVKKIRVIASAQDEADVCGQSKICNWGFNKLLDQLHIDYTRYGELCSMLDFGCDIVDEADELRREKWELYQRLFSKYGIRYQLTDLKEKYPFLRLVHSSPLKNMAQRLTDTFVQWRKRRHEGYGFPQYRSWSKKFFSLKYDEKKGWNTDGTKLHLAFGQRVLSDDELTKGQKKALERKRLADPSAVLCKNTGVDLTLAEPAPKDAYKLEVVREGGELFAVFTRKAKRIAAPKAVSSYIYLDPNHKNLVYGLGNDGRAVEVANRPGLKVQAHRIDHLRSKRDKAVRNNKLVQFTREDGSEHKHWEPSNAYYRRDKALHREETKRRDQNKTFVHTTLHRLFDQHQVIGLGDYLPEPKDHRLGKTSKGRKKANRTINNMSLLGKLQLALPHVAAKRGRLGYVMDEQGTTRTCHVCKHVVAGGIHPDVRAWVCPGCGDRHLRDENACQNGLGRLHTLLSEEGLLGNPTCDALASDGHQCSDVPVKSGVMVAYRCDWTLDLDGSCRIVGKPQATVDKFFALARHVGAGEDRARRNSGVGDATPDAVSRTHRTPGKSGALVDSGRLC